MVVNRLLDLYIFDFKELFLFNFTDFLWNLSKMIKQTKKNFDIMPLFNKFCNMFAIVVLLNTSNFLACSK